MSERYEGFMESDHFIKTLTVDNIGDLRWMTRSGEVLKLKDIPDDHVRNIALMLMDMGYSQYHSSSKIKIIWLTALQLEWRRRRQQRRWVTRSLSKKEKQEIDELKNLMLGPGESNESK